MFKFHDIEQNTEEWLNLRSGKITASAMSKIMPHYPKKLGEPAKVYAQKLAVERATKTRINDSFSNHYMEKGHDLEPIARELYEDHTFSKVTNGGFFELGDLGCSPDGLIGNDGMIEIKCEKWNVFFPYLEGKKLYNTAYRDQIQFNLFVTGREWCDFVSYCEELPESRQLHIHRIYPDAERFAEIRVRVAEIKDKVGEYLNLLV